MDDRPDPADAEPERRVPLTEIEHPDPRTLCEPEHDEQGLLRWATLPLGHPR